MTFDIFQIYSPNIPQYFPKYFLKKMKLVTFNISKLFPKYSPIFSQIFFQIDLEVDCLWYFPKYSPIVSQIDWEVDGIWWQRKLHRLPLPPLAIALPTEYIKCIIISIFLCLFIIHTPLKRVTLETSYHKGCSLKLQKDQIIWRIFQSSSVLVVMGFSNHIVSPLPPFFGTFCGKGLVTLKGLVKL